MVAETEGSPYFALVNHPGEGVRLSNVERYCPTALLNIDTLMKVSLVYGQRYLFERDMLLYYIGKPLRLE